MKMEDGLQEKVPKTASNRTLLMEIVKGNVQVLILVLKKFLNPFEVISTV